MDFNTFRDSGLLREFGRVFTDLQMSRAVLRNIDFPMEAVPSFGEGFWSEVCATLAHGRVVSGLERLIDEAARMFPGNALFAHHNRLAIARSGGPPQTASTVSIQFMACNDPLALADAARAAAVRLDIRTEIGISYAVGATAALHLDTTVENALRIAEELAKGGRSLGTPYATRPFRDYLLERLFIEGPDQDRFVASLVPASTTTRAIVGGTMDKYKDEMRRDGHGRARPSVVDHVKADGTTVRLSPDATLHDSHVRDGDTLQVSPESTAGALHPRIREEALARVRTQILDYAAGHPDFEVFANAVQAPTEYLFRFRAPGWGPPIEQDGPPTPIEEHEVFLSLPPQFPMKAPAVFWQSPQFHPNIDPDTGFVCLGELDDGYRPGMDFAKLCQLLVEVAAYRNYGLAGGFYDTAAATWVNSIAGQMDIERRGGHSKIRDAIAQVLDEQGLAPALRIQRVRT